MVHISVQLVNRNGETSMSHILGLTGGIATGKSTVSDFLKERGIPVVDADLAARKVVEPGSSGLKKIEGIFGEKILLKSGELNRKALAEIIFSDEKMRKKLNECLKDDIYEWITSEKESLIQEKHRLIVLDIPLLFEGKYTNEVDTIMVVSCSADKQVKRLMNRNDLSEREARERIATQMPLDKKIKNADVVIDNNGTKEETRKQVLNWLIQKGYYTN